MALDPLYALTLSVSLVVVLVLLRIDVAVALGTGLILYAATAVGRPERVLEIVSGSMNTTLATALASLVQAMFLADLYRLSGVAEKMVRGVSCAGRRFAGVAIPAIVGLLPMPGGAYVSAVLADPVYREVGFSSELKTFVNYWFRHIWIPIWPLYQNIIIASGLLGMSIREIFDVNWVITLSSILSGLAVMYTGSRRAGAQGGGAGRGPCSPRDLVHLWPFLSIAVLNLVLRVHLVLSILATVLVFIAVYRPGVREVLEALRYSLNPSLIILIIEVFVFGDMIRYTGVAGRLSEALSGYIVLAVFAVPLVIGFATAAEFAYVALAFPPFIDLFHRDHSLLTLAFLGGFLGVMLSPSHACLVLSARYYETVLARPYRYIVPAVVLTTAATVSLLLALHGLSRL